jgi:lipopolysaccharide heptosyltransferase II
MDDCRPLIVRPVAGRPWRERILTTCFVLLHAAFRPFMSTPRLPAGRCRIVVVKPCCLGDVLMATPVIAALRARFPESTIDFAVGRHARPAIEGHREIAAMVDAGLGAGRDWRSLLHLVARLRAGRYDVCLVLERSPLFTILPLLAGIRVRAGIDSGGRGFALNAGVPWDESLHEADLYLSVAGALGCPIEGHHLTFVPGRPAQEAVEQLWRQRNLGSRVIAIAPGGGTNPGMDLPEKRWLPERFAELADRLYDSEGAQIAIVGSSLDAPVCRAMRAAMRAPSIDLTGHIPFAERAAFFQRCLLYVGNDSGPMHLAVASGCPVVGVFGPSPVHLYRPYGGRARTVRLDIPCSPCFVHGNFPRCPNRHACMQELQASTVASACRELLAQTMPC